MSTHEQFIHEVAALVASRLNEKERALIEETKLVYGAGPNGTRGITYYDRWNGNGHGAVPFVEICAFTQESWVQIAGTTIHEMAHVLCGMGVGHSTAWKFMCDRIGLRVAKAAGHRYTLSSFDPEMRAGLVALDKPSDGEPTKDLTLTGRNFVLRVCGAGIGTKGGKSRGTGSGSRMKLYQCECEPPVKVRHAGNRFDATCNCCNTSFTQ